MSTAIEFTLRNAHPDTIARMRALLQALPEDGKEHKVGFKSFTKAFGRFESKVYFGGNGYYTKAVSEDEAVCLSLNLAHFTGRSAGRNRKVIEVVLGGR